MMPHAVYKKPDYKSKFSHVLPKDYSMVNLFVPGDEICRV